MTPNTEGSILRFREAEKVKRYVAFSLFNTSISAHQLGNHRFGESPTVCFVDGAVGERVGFGVVCGVRSHFHGKTPQPDSGNGNAFRLDFGR